jgi:ATP-dependent DNA ligase
MHLHLFDLQLEGIREVGRLEFMIFISSILTKHIGAKWVHVIPSYIVHDHNQLNNYLNDFINQGYEGAIVRLSDGQYYPEKRSRTVLKMVVMDFAEAIVTDVIPMEKNPKLGKFVVSLIDGPGVLQTMTLTPGLGYTEKIKQDLLTNKAKYIGTIVKYTHRGFSKEGIPRIAVAYLGKLEDEDGE